MKIKLDPGAYPLERAHPTDAGLDIRSPINVLVRPKQSATIHTGVHVQLPFGTAGLIVSKSGLNVFDSVTSTGLIDEGYTGEIVVKLYNHDTNHHKVIKRGGKTMTNAESMVVRWPGYQETASPKWIAIKRGERGYSAGDFRCSECGKPNPCWSLTEYCPNCGEHMKEGT